MQTKKIIIGLAIIGLILTGCASVDPLTGTAWLLQSLDNQTRLSATQVTLKFENGQIMGSDGCNSYSTSYTLNKRNINLNKNIASTMMACPEPIMQQASAYTTALVQIVAYKIEGQQLSLVDASGKTRAFFTKQGNQ
jgi:heat shock protein HslJ